MTVRMIAAIAVAWILVGVAQSGCTRSKAEREHCVPDLPLSEERDLGGFALVRIEHAEFFSDAGTDPATLDVYRTINRICCEHSARRLFGGPVGGGVRVRYMSIPASSAQRFVRELQSTIQDVVTTRYSDHVWRVHKVKIDVIDPAMMLMRVEFKDRKWLRSRKTIVPDVRVSMWDVCDAGRTESLKSPFGCSANAVAATLQDPSYGLPDDMKLQLAILATKPRLKCDLYLRDRIFAYMDVQIRGRDFEFQCP